MTSEWRGPHAQVERLDGDPLGGEAMRLAALAH